MKLSVNLFTTLDGVSQGAGIIQANGPAQAMDVTRSSVTPNGVLSVEMTPREFGAPGSVP